jgi:hypothetical protein
MANGEPVNQPTQEKPQTITTKGGSRRTGAVEESTAESAAESATESTPDEEAGEESVAPTHEPAPAIASRSEAPRIPTTEATRPEPPGEVVAPATSMAARMRFGIRSRRRGR